MRDAYLPSQVTFTCMSRCADFRYRFFELGLSVIVLASRRQLAVEDEAMALAFTRVAVLERERCFLISYAEHRANVTVQFQCIFRRSVPCGTAKRLQRCAEDGRNTEERSQLERRRRNWRLFTPGSPLRVQSRTTSITLLHIR